MTHSPPRHLSNEYAFQYKKNRDAAKVDFDAQNEALIDEMTMLYEGRVDYLTPSVHALISLQVTPRRFPTLRNKCYTI